MFQHWKLSSHMVKESELTAVAAGLPGATPLQVAKGFARTSSIGILLTSADSCGLANTISRRSLILSERPRRSFRSSMTRLYGNKKQRFSFNMAREAAKTKKYLHSRQANIVNVYISSWKTLVVDQ